MSMTPTTRTMCEMLSGEAGHIISFASKSASKISGYIRNVEIGLNRMTPTPDIELQNAIDDFNDDVDDITPGSTSSDVDEVIDIIDACIFLSDHDLLSNPVSCTGNFSSYLLSKVGDLLPDKPEFDFGGVLSSIQDMFSGALPGGENIAGMLESLDKAIDCIDSVCGSEYSSEVSRLTGLSNDLYDTLYMESDPANSNYGKLKLTDIYTNAGLSPGVISNMDDVIGSVDDSKSNIVNATSSLEDAVKDFLF